MFARVNTVFSEREKAIVVPEEAIVPQAGKQFVIKLLDGADKGTEKETKTTQRVEVKVDIRRPGKVEILEGLAEGDEVVTAGQQRVQKDGTSVKVVELGKPGGKPLSTTSTAASTARPTATPTATPSPTSGAAPAAAPAINPAPFPATAAASPAMPGKPQPIANVAQKPLQGPNPCFESVSASGFKSAGNMRRKS
jgi:membrane fusion protein (multidrug efflux system)